MRSLSSLATRRHLNHGTGPHPVIGRTNTSRAKSYRKNVQHGRRMTPLQPHSTDSRKTGRYGSRMLSGSHSCDTAIFPIEVIFAAEAIIHTGVNENRETYHDGHTNFGILVLTCFATQLTKTCCGNLGRYPLSFLPTSRGVLDGHVQPSFRTAMLSRRLTVPKLVFDERWRLGIPAAVSRMVQWLHAAFSIALDCHCSAARGSYSASSSITSYLVHNILIGSFIQDILPL